jgi:hypothetical protein
MQILEFIEQNSTIISLIIGLLSAVGSIVLIVQFWSKKISPKLHKLYNLLKLKIRQAGGLMSSKEVKKRLEDFGEILNRLSQELSELKNRVVSLEKSESIETISSDKKRLSISTDVELIATGEPKLIRFKFAIDNRLTETFLLDRILYEADLTSDDHMFRKIVRDFCIEPIQIKGDDTTAMSRISEVTYPEMLPQVNSEVEGLKKDIKCHVTIKAYLKTGNKLKLLQPTPVVDIKYSDWEKWYKPLKQHKIIGL